MNFTKYISANILSFLGIIGCILFACLFYLSIFFLPSYNIIVGIIVYLAYLYFAYYIQIIPYLILLLLFEILLNKLTNDKFIINIPIKNEHKKRKYYKLFIFGIISSILYIIVFFWYISGFDPNWYKIK